MKHIFFYVCILLSAYIVTSCIDKDETVIYGKVTEQWDGKKIILSTTGSSGNRQLATTEIKKNKFKIKIKPDSTFIALLRIDMGLNNIPYLLPIAIEPGKIEVLMGKETSVSGTPLNEKLQDFMIEKDIYIEKDTISDNTGLEHFYKFIDSQIQKYSDTPSLAHFIKIAYGKK